MSTVEVVDDDVEFFAPTSTDAVARLVAECDGQRRLIDKLAAMMASSDAAQALHYFLEGNATSERSQGVTSMSVAQLFDPAGAVAVLNAAYWSKALQLTDVINMMPQRRRNEWNEQIRNPAGVKRSRHDAEWQVPPLPDFTEDNVRNTLADLLAMRSQFLAERVDGIFRGLSGEHVTNAPEAFGKRMIVSRVLNAYGGTDHAVTGLLNDLRAVVAKFMGRDEPHYQATDRMVRHLMGRWGEWVSVDGGALRLRLYKKGTAHLEVHPDMAWRLNQVLAHLYPLAIPAQFRQRPARRARAVERIQRPLPFAVLSVLADMKPATVVIPESAETRWEKRYREVPRTLAFGFGARDKHVEAEAERVLASVGGVRGPEGWFVFDYEPREVRDEIVASGCVPDQRSHQFYPTPPGLAARLVDVAGIGSDDLVLEPSAGTGGIADLLPRERTRCVEVSRLHCSVLEAKGHAVECADFMAWRPTAGLYFDRVVMNPPFDRGQWVAHVEHAAKFLRAGGRLAAVLPSGARERDFLPGWSKAWHGPFDGEFAGTSISVVILVTSR